MIEIEIITALGIPPMVGAFIGMLMEEKLATKPTIIKILFVTVICLAVISVSDLLILLCGLLELVVSFSLVRIGKWAQKYDEQQKAKKISANSKIINK